MSLMRAKSVDAHVGGVRQAVFAVDDLRERLEYDIEDTARSPAFLAPLQEGIQALYDPMKYGRYAFGREDLPFMDLAGEYAEEIPFHTLLKQINETHRRDLDVGGDDA